MGERYTWIFHNSLQNKYVLIKAMSGGGFGPTRTRRGAVLYFTGHLVGLLKLYQISLNIQKKTEIMRARGVLKTSPIQGFRELWQSQSTY